MNETDEQNASGNEESVDWAAVKRAYADPAIRVRETAAKLGMTWQALSAKATKEGWPLRGDTRSIENRLKGQRVGAVALRHTTLVTRLKRLVEREIGDIEKEYEQEGVPADREKAAKRLTVLVRSLDKLTEIQNAGATRRKKGTKDEHGGEALRTELERRLARLAAASEETGVSNGPDSEGSGVSG